MQNHRESSAFPPCAIVVERSVWQTTNLPTSRLCLAERFGLQTFLKDKSVDITHIGLAMNCFSPYVAV